MFDQKTTPHIWTIVEFFYRAHAVYLRQYDRYEKLVAQYVEHFGMPRQEIRLEPHELSGLLHFKEMEELRDVYLLPLKEACHTLFRTDNATDFIDRLVNDIFHEISILKEEHYNILTYQPGDNPLSEELETILDEVHTMFPIKVHRLRHLFELALERIEALLPAYKENQVLIRSLYLHRFGFVQDAYDEGLVDFYRLLYGSNDIYLGFRLVGDSFHRSGFYSHAIDAFSQGLDYMKNASSGTKNAFDESWQETVKHMSESIDACREQIAYLEAD